MTPDRECVNALSLLDDPSADVPTDPPESAQSVHTKRVTCTFHCRPCGAHFHSLAAFDAHRVFLDPKKPDWDERYCDLPDNKLEPLTTSGRCNIVKRDAVTIYVTPGSVHRARSAFAPSDPSE